MINILLLLADAIPDPVIGLGAGGGIAGLVLFIWRQERKESLDRWVQERKETQERYHDLAANFRVIVEQNTVALTRLNEKISGGVVDCPYARNQNAKA